MVTIETAKEMEFVWLVIVKNVDLKIEFTFDPLEEKKRIREVGRSGNE